MYVFVCRHVTKVHNHGFSFCFIYLSPHHSLSFCVFPFFHSFYSPLFSLITLSTFLSYHHVVFHCAGHLRPTTYLFSGTKHNLIQQDIYDFTNINLLQTWGICTIVNTLILHEATLFLIDSISITGITTTHKKGLYITGFNVLFQNRDTLCRMWILTMHNSH